MHESIVYADLSGFSSSAFRQLQFSCASAYRLHCGENSEARIAASARLQMKSTLADAHLNPGRYFDNSVTSVLRACKASISPATT